MGTKSKLQEELSNTTDKLNFLIDNENERLEGIEGTPFGMLTNKQTNTYCATLGNYRFEEFKSKKEVHKWVNEITWNKIMLVFNIMMEFNEKQK